MRWLFLVAVYLFSLPAAASACTPSSGGTRSFDLQIAPGAGIFVFYRVHVYDGATCDPAHLLGMGPSPTREASRIAITDAGVVIGVLARRTSRRSWSIVRVMTVGEGARVVSLALDDMPETAGLRGSVAVTVDVSGVSFRDRSSEVRVSLSDLSARLALGGGPSAGASDHETASPSARAATPVE